MSQFLPLDAAALARFDVADVIFLAQDGLAVPSARVRCYNFAKALRQQGLKAEVLSLFDHLGATDQSGPLSTIPEEEKLRLNLMAHAVLARNTRAVLYVQKVGYHTLAAMLAASRGGNRLILDYDDYELDMQPFRRLEAWLPSLRPTELLATIASRSAACIAASHRLQAILAPLNPNTHLIHTVADQELFNPDGRAAPRRRFGDTVNILYSGAFWGDIPMKDVLFSVDAFALVPRRIRERARFHIIGFGRAWEELKRRIRERYPAMDGIVLHEFIAPDTFGTVLNEMDIGVLPYSDNAFNIAKSPTKMFEYLLAKVAVCATPVGESTHCLEHGRTGLFASDIEGFAENLACLIADEELRHGIAEAAYRLAMERYSLQGVADRLAGIVRESLHPCVSTKTETTLDEFLTRTLGRSRPIAPREVHLVRSDLRALLAAENPATADPRRWSGPLLAALDWPGLHAIEGVDPDRARTLRRTGERCRNAARLRPDIRLPRLPRPLGPPSLAKLAATEDWEDDLWWSWAKEFRTNYATFRVPYAGDDDTERLNDEDVRNNVCNYFKRSHGTWERVQFLYGLDRLGLMDGRARFLVMSGEVDGLYLMLTGHACHVDVLDLSDRAAEHAARVVAGETDLWLTKPRRFRRDCLTVHHGPADALDGRCWDAVLLPQNTVLRNGLAETLAWVDKHLEIGGVVAFSTWIRLDGGRDDEVPTLPAASTGPDGLAALLERCTGMSLPCPFDASLSDSTLDRFVVTGAPDSGNPHLVARTGGTLHMTGVWFCRKHGPTPSGGWDRLRAALAGKTETVG